MKSYNVEIGSKLKLESLSYRVKANSKEEAKEKVRRLGFNCGERLSSSFKGDFVPTQISEMKEVTQ